MIDFKILKKSRKSGARLAILKTPHGEVLTPSLVPVATQGVVKTLTSEEVLQAKSQMLICNTFHLHLRPGEKLVASHKGLHGFMKWPKPLMTDSGGFQVFSLGFGRDLRVGKIANKKSKTIQIVGTESKPRFVRIQSDGVLFRSPIDGAELFLGPKESIKIQENLGADIIFAFDECTPPNADYEYTKRSLVKTHAWAKDCLKARVSKQALYGIVQGGKYKDLRIESAKAISAFGFDGIGIGGEFGDSKKTMGQMLKWVFEYVDERLPRHLLGIGRIEDIIPIIKSGVDTFDCIVPTHYARRGVAFTSVGKLDFKKSKFLKEKKGIDPKCDCSVCQTYSRAYISHLLKAGEITPLKLLTFHNLYFFNSYIASVREKIKKGIL